MQGGRRKVGIRRNGREVLGNKSDRRFDLCRGFASHRVFFILTFFGLGSILFLFRLLL